MATLALAAVGATAGSALLPTGITLFGATLSGAALGSQAGALAGSFVDNALFGASGQPGPRTVEGPRLSDLQVTSSTEGAPIPRLYGRARLGGQLIWAEPIRERVIKTTTGTDTGGGKGSSAASSGSSTTERIEYRYSATFAVALAEGTISGIGRVWADGRELDLARVTHRIHLGGESQSADSTIVAYEGADGAPAYRGTAYIVFEDMELAEFGNRLPQLAFEVFLSVEPFAKEIKGVVLIPGAGEFVYATSQVSKVLGGGRSAPENTHTLQGSVDWTVSLDQLEQTLPNAKSASLIVSWFGDDLRAGVCQVKPGVEATAKTTSPDTWSVAGLSRAGAHLVSTIDGRPAYGGTPSDASVIAAIEDLKDRGFDVTLTPFVLMDVPAGNGLTDPYGASEQAPYPWRGRITCSPAPGEPGSPDQSATAATQISDFVGTADVSDFAIVDGSVVYSGPAEWSYRRMVLHQAHLALAAGGVDAFLIGTELRGLTWVRSAAATYPFVNALVDLAADVKGLLGSGTTVLYAADWSEYFGHQPADGTSDVYFHLDPLWASASIDAIGIDVYWPLADWRDGAAHTDYAAGTHAIYELAYLRSNVQGGEGYDWYYASDSDRDTQTRTPITDGAGKPWVFRYKDIRSWWQNQHFNRPGGSESGTPTAWVPESKPFRLMEIGCPAIDKGANQPNVFVDPKSSESHVPYFSRGTRDDLMQRRYLRALIEAFDPTSDGYVAGANPVSGVTGDRMVDLHHIHVYTWDMRPYPAFPNHTDVWGDGDNWRLGHWLNGRFASAPLGETVAALLDDYGFADHDTSALYGTVDGIVVDRVMSPRDALQPLELAYFFDSIESGGEIVFRHRGLEPAVAGLTEDHLVEERPGDTLLTLVRGQETELPASAKVSFLAASADYRRAVAESRRLTGASARVSQAELPLVLEFERAGEIADTWLFEAWASRERASFTLPPSALAIEPGDVVGLDVEGETRLVRVTEVGEHGSREIEARAVDPEVYGGAVAPVRTIERAAPEFIGQPLAVLLDLPLLRGDEPAEAGYFAAVQSPWPGAVSLFSSPETTGYALRAVAHAPAVMGVTTTSLDTGPTAVLDRANSVTVEIYAGELASVTELQLLAGRNIAAVVNSDGEWEVFQFQTATLVAPSTYTLSGLLRGQGGTEAAMESPLAAGATFVLLSSEVATVPLTLNEIRLPLNWRYGPSRRDIGDASYVATAHTFEGRGLRPLAPVHVTGTRASGDLAIAWVRRTRIGGDNWDVAEVPLGETSEAYEIDILDGATVKRTLAATTPAATYTAAQQTTDFGAPQSAVSVKVYQLGAVYGRGGAAAAVV